MRDRTGLVAHLLPVLVATEPDAITADHDLSTVHATVLNVLDGSTPRATWAPPECIEPTSRSSAAGFWDEAAPDLMPMQKGQQTDENRGRRNRFPSPQLTRTFTHKEPIKRRGNRLA
ncbi:MAG: hypothetical protein ACRDTG_32990 [Pseudonocardiaceae bacterium]